MDVNEEAFLALRREIVGRDIRRRYDVILKTNVLSVPAAHLATSWPFVYLLFRLPRPSVTLHPATLQVQPYSWKRHDIKLTAQSWIC